MITTETIKGRRILKKLFSAIIHEEDTVVLDMQTKLISWPLTRCLYWAVLLRPSILNVKQKCQKTFVLLLEVAQEYVKKYIV